MNLEQIKLQLLLPKLIAFLHTNPAKTTDGVYVNEEQACCALGWAVSIYYPNLPITRDAFYLENNPETGSPINEINRLFRAGEFYPVNDFNKVCYCKDQPCGNGLINRLIKASDQSPGWDASIKVLESGLHKLFQKWFDSFEDKGGDPEFIWREYFKRNAKKL